MNLASVSWLLLLACSHEAVPKYLIWSRHVISSSLIKRWLKILMCKCIVNRVNRESLSAAGDRRRAK